jgi:hypothetical protein
MWAAIPLPRRAHDVGSIVPSRRAWAEEPLTVIVFGLIYRTVLLGSKNDECPDNVFHLNHNISP